MRPFEILLVAATRLAFFALVVPLAGRAGWRRAAAMALLSIAACLQLLIEGLRWQMVPAYALGGLFFLVWLLQTVATDSWPGRKRWATRLAVGLGVGLGVLGLAVSIGLRPRTTRHRLAPRPIALRASIRRHIPSVTASRPRHGDARGRIGDAWRVYEVEGLRPLEASVATSPTRVAGGRGASAASTQPTRLQPPTTSTHWAAKNAFVNAYQFQ